MASRRKKAIDEEIDRNLKRAFDALADEPLPDRFSSLLQRLRDGGQGDGSGPKDGDAKD